MPVLIQVSVAGGPPFPAALHQGRLLALAWWREAPLRGSDSMAALLRHWRVNQPLLRALLGDPATHHAIATQGVRLEEVQLHAPVAPGQVFCTIGNYRAQVIEAALDADDGPAGAQAPQRRAAAEAAVARRRRDGTPYVCFKGTACVAGPQDDLPLPRDVATLDWEVEIGVVIGRTAWQVPASEAMSHVAGYCVVNDLTCRERVTRHEPTGLGTDWVQAKSHPGWLPTGPWLVPAWAVPDVAGLRLSLRLNGQTMQDGQADDMVFSIAEQIAYLSRHTRLEAGDLLCSGSPAGFGLHHGRFLRPGDIVEASVQGLGAQRVVCTGGVL